MQTKHFPLENIRFQSSINLNLFEIDNNDTCHTNRRASYGFVLQVFTQSKFVGLRNRARHICSNFHSVASKS